MHFGIFSVKTDTGRKPREKRGEKEQEKKAPPLEGRTNLESDRKKIVPSETERKEEQKKDRVYIDLLLLLLLLLPCTFPKQQRMHLPTAKQHAEGRTSPESERKKLPNVPSCPFW